MAVFVGGIVAAVLGVILLLVWYEEFFLLLAGALPMMLILGGVIAAYLGFDEVKDKLPYYSKKEGVKRLSTETGTGQWGSALAFACNMFELECKVYMVNVSYQQKPYRRILMEAWGATVVPSPGKDRTDCQDAHSRARLCASANTCRRTTLSRHGTHNLHALRSWHR